MRLLPRLTFSTAAILLFSTNLNANQQVVFDDWLNQGVANFLPSGTATVVQGGVTFELSLTSENGNLRTNQLADKLSIYGGRFDGTIDEGMNNSDPVDDESVTLTLITDGLELNSLSLSRVTLVQLDQTGERVEFRQDSGILAAWNAFEPNDGSPANDASPDHLAVGMSALLGTEVNAASQQGGGAINSESKDLGGSTYGSLYLIPSENQGATSGIELNTWGGNNRHVDIQVTNSTPATTMVESIHFDIRQIYGAVGAVVKVSHFGNAGDGFSDLQDAFRNRDLLNTSLSNDDFNTIHEFDVSTSAMNDVTLAPGESAAFRIYIEDNGSSPEHAVWVDNIAIVGSSIYTYVSDAANVNVIDFNYTGSGGESPLYGMEALSLANQGRWQLKIVARDGDGSPTQFSLRSLTFDYTIVPLPPVAENDLYELESGTTYVSGSLSVLDNDIDPNGDSLSVTAVTQPSHGALVLNLDGTFTYTPDAMFNGTDSFSYQVNDGSEDSNVASVTLNVAAYVEPSGDYYIDPYLGDDANDGTSPARAWRTLSSVSQSVYVPGVRILLRRGATHHGQLFLNNVAGAPGSPIIIGAYGAGESRPVIDATLEDAAIKLGYVEYVEIEDMELVGKGIKVELWGRWRSNPWEHFHFRNLYIHDVAGAGISMTVSNLGPFTINDVSITDSVFENIGGAGITINKWAGEGVLTVKELSGPDVNRVAGLYTNVPSVNLSNENAEGATFDVTVDDSGAVIDVAVAEKGAGYKSNDLLEVLDVDLGSGGAENLSFRVDLDQPAEPNEYYHDHLLIEGNRLTNIDGAGIQVGKIRSGIIRNNVVLDPGRDYNAAGSGLWTWYCGTTDTVFLVERNVFRGSQGVTDSCGAHIDIGCVNNIYQYNLSEGNEGGFVEILGKSRNCVYRYNISINDGGRSPGRSGNTIYFGGYTGIRGPYLGPYNSYVYNNTIYVRPDISADFSIGASTAGALIANNVFYLQGDVPVGAVDLNALNIVMDNNLIYQQAIPSARFDVFTRNYDADPQFKNTGGLESEDYIPLNVDDLIDRSLELYRLPGDSVGVLGGFAVTEDFFGNPIVGQPDIGAIEFSESIHWLIENGMEADLDLATVTTENGLRLLEVYAFGLDMKMARARDLPRIEPQLDGNHLLLRFYAGASDVSYELLKSSDLSTWSPVPSAWASGPDSDGYYDVVIPDEASAFFRFKLMQRP